MLFLLHNPLAGQKNIQIIHTDTLPTIDGQYADISDKLAGYHFIRLEPNNGDTSLSQTSIAVMQNTEAMYIAVVCFQEVPVTANIQVRDKFAQNDDGIYVMLGTFNDNRNAFCFAVNPLGTQTDFRLMDDGRTVDYNWDTQWQSGSGIFEGGWCAELIIPFKSIKFREGLSEWQINFRRNIREQSEISYWDGKVTEEYKISLSGRLTGIRPGETRNTLVLIPYGMGKITFDRVDGGDYYFDKQAGGDIIWQPNSNLTANITVNPDFATVEADEDVIDLTKYEIQYPEKRVFFRKGMRCTAHD